MEWYRDGDMHRLSYRGVEMLVMEVEPLVVKWHVVMQDGSTRSGTETTVFVAKCRAEKTIRPKTKSTAQFSRMRREMVRDHGTSEPFWYEHH